MRQNAWWVSAALVVSAGMGVSASGQETAPATQPQVAEDGPPKWKGYAESEEARARVQRELDARWHWERMTIAELEAEVAQRKQHAYELAVTAYRADPRLREAEVRYREVKQTLDDHTQAFLTAESVLRRVGAPEMEIRALGRDRMATELWAQPVERAFWTEAARPMVEQLATDEAQLAQIRAGLAEAGRELPEDADAFDLYVAAFEMQLKDPGDLDEQLREIAEDYAVAWAHVDVIAKKGGWVSAADYAFGITQHLTPAELHEARRLSDLAGKALRNRRFAAERAAEAAE
ncbi:MAG: hypothetical protein AAGA57_11055 [Planctomycetota bacterium]